MRALERPAEGRGNTGGRGWILPGGWESQDWDTFPELITGAQKRPQVQKLFRV